MKNVTFRLLDTDKQVAPIYEAYSPFKGGRVGFGHTKAQALAELEGYQVKKLIPKDPPPTSTIRSKVKVYQEGSGSRDFTLHKAEDRASGLSAFGFTSAHAFRQLTRRFIEEVEK